jgi:lysophospholipase L1-like esterase
MRVRSLVARTGSNLLALAAGIALVELVLQGAALWVGGEAPAGLVGLEPGVPRVLCLGDSNTWGFGVEPDNAWPQQLEAVWNADREPLIEVLNFGYPGTNSSQVRRDLRRAFEAVHPDVVILMVGVNDLWTLPVPVDADDDERSAPRRFLDRYSRLWRLAWSARRALSSSAVEVAGEGLSGENLERARGWIRYRGEVFDRARERAPDGVPGALMGLLENLSAIPAEARGFGAEPVMMTYPSRLDFYASANNTIRIAAAASRVRLVDLEAEFAQVCPEAPCPEWLMADGHPTEQGYRRIAEILVRELPRTFAP